MTLLAVIDAAGNYQYYVDAVLDSYGTYSLVGNQVTFNDDVGMADPCPNPGVYTYSITANQVTFTLVSDNCMDRYNGVVGTWAK